MWTQRISPNLVLAALFFHLATSVCQGHFLWLASETVEGQQRAIAFFGENAEDRTYKIPEALKGIRVTQRTTTDHRRLAMTLVESENFVGFRSPSGVGDQGVLEAKCQYGVYHGTLLTYYAKHYVSHDSQRWQSLPVSAEQALDVTVSAADNDSVTLQVFWQGKPTDKAKVSYLSAADSEEKPSTDGEGRVTFRQLNGPLLSFLVAYTDKEASGELNGEKYKTASHYAAITIPYPADQADKPTADEDAALRARRRPSLENVSDAAAEATANTLPQLPEPLSSFGAAVSDGYLYVYGGHIGKAHAHSRDNLSRRFVRIPLGERAAWEDLPFQTPVQGLALVAHQGMLYRIGGMSATNATGEPDDLHSTADFASFDPRRGDWTALMPLPEARSSHDAAVLGSQLYVVGGWKLSGTSEGRWHQQSLVIDLSEPNAQWTSLPDQPFERRALAVVAFDNRVIALGGIDSAGETTGAMDIYDPQSKTWSVGPEFPAEGMRGFGVSAWVLGDVLYASGSDGVIYSLREIAGHWQAVGELQQPRFFHRLVAAPDGALWAVGGAAKSGHLQTIERWTPPVLSRRGNSGVE